jgi:nitrite reductase (NADH) large subunit
MISSDDVMARQSGIFDKDEAVNRFVALARWVAVLAVVGVAASLATKAWWRGVRSLDLFWQVIVPLVPLTLLVAPHFWRRICPIAVLNLAAARIRPAGREIGPARLPHKANVWIKRYGVMLAACLLWLLAPMRILLFNQSAHATLALILAMAVAAVTLGIVGPWKAAWCSSVCPVYPVEKLYGAAPVWSLPDSRCVPANSALGCYRCALHCLDVPVSETRYWNAMERAGSKHPADVARRFFLGSFPGFVLAYWALSGANGFPRPFLGAPIVAVYATFFLFMIASYGCYVVAHLFFAGSEGRRRLSLENHRVDLVVTALALNLYYAAGSARFSTVLSQLGGWRAGQSIIRAGILGFILVISLAWLRRAWRSSAPPWARW